MIYEITTPTYDCENYLSGKIHFMCFFLASLLIALELLFLHGIGAQGFSSSIELRSASSLLSLFEEELDLSLQDFLLVLFLAGCGEFLLERINSAVWILHQL